MAEYKQSTKTKELNTVEPKHEHFLPEYGLTVQAANSEEAVKIAKRIKQEQK